MLSWAETNTSSLKEKAHLCYVGNQKHTWEAMISDVAKEMNVVNHSIKKRQTCRNDITTLNPSVFH